MSRALTAYRIAAWIVGVWLLLLVAAMVAKYGLGQSAAVEVIGPVHGFLFMGYVAVTIWLGAVVRWPIGRLVLVILAGTVPFLSFVAERSVTREVGARLHAASTT